MVSNSKRHACFNGHKLAIRGAKGDIIVARLTACTLKKEGVKESYCARKREQKNGELLPLSVPDLRLRNAGLRGVLLARNGVSHNQHSLCCI